MAPGRAGSAPPPSPGRRLPTFGAASFVLLFGLLAAWAIATPLFGAPDEPAHVIKAAAVAHGEFLGQVRGGDAAAKVTVTVPATIARAASTPVCFAFKPRQPADCQAAFHSAAGSARLTTYVGRYPPLYYLLVGVPTLLVHSPGVIYLMRLVSAAISAALLAAAAVSAGVARRSRWMLAGVAVAASPMVLFLGGVVNPSGMEISSALCVWASGVVLGTEPDNSHRRGLLIRLVLGAAILVQTRGLSPLWLALAALVLVGVAGRGRAVGLLRQRDVRIGLAVVAVCGVFGVAWILLANSLAIAPVGTPVAADASRLGILHAALNRTRHDARDLVGIFGWRDTPAPRITYAIWVLAAAAIVVAVVVAAIARRRPRHATAVLLLCVLSVVIPTLLSASQAHKDGIVGQGRYVLPLVVGIPVVAAGAFDRRPPPRWLLPLAGVALAAAQGSAFVEALRRYRSGLGTSLLAHGDWSPPIPVWPLVGGFGVLLLALYLLWWSASAQRP